PEQQRKQRTKQEKQKGLRQDRGIEVAPGDDEGRAEKLHHATGPSPAIAAAALLPAMATKASCKPGRSIASVSMPAPPSINALSSGSGPPAGSSNTHSSP